MFKTYLFLVGAILFEVAGTMLLPVTQNFTKFIPTTFLTIFYLCAFYLLTFVVNKLPIAIVYATWSGLGIFTISILGYIFFKQALTWHTGLHLPKTHSDLAHQQNLASTSPKPSQKVRIGLHMSPSA